MGQKVKFPYIFTYVSIVRPTDPKHWKDFLHKAAARIRNKNGAIFEIDEKNKQVIIRKYDIPVKSL